jgi:FkbM family methyltransferase
MAEALEFLTRLESRYQNSDIDWEGLLEADYLTLLSGRDGLNIIDIGGHAGRHSRAIQDRLRPAHLLIFEPLPEQCRKLMATFAQDLNVSVQNMALSNVSGASTFVVKQKAPEESGLRQRTFYNDGQSSDLEHIQVQVDTLDNLDLQLKVDFIKIDTEGGEIDILRGGRRLLQRDAPIISVEYGPGGYDAYGHKPETLYEFGGEAGYALFDLFGNRFGSIDEWRACVARFYWDFFLIPVARLPELSDRLVLLRSRARERFL